MVSFLVLVINPFQYVRKHPRRTVKTGKFSGIASAYFHICLCNVDLLVAVCDSGLMQFLVSVYSRRTCIHGTCYFVLYYIMKQAYMMVLQCTSEKVCKVLCCVSSFRWTLRVAKVYVVLLSSKYKLICYFENMPTNCTFVVI